MNHNLEKTPNTEGEKTQAERDYEDFWKFVESEAAKYEITCDYYLMEFF